MGGEVLIIYRDVIPPVQYDSDCSTKIWVLAEKAAYESFEWVCSVDLFAKGRSFRNFCLPVC